MGDLTEKIPKPLVEVHDKPILWYSFWGLYSAGFRKFILPLGYKGEMIQSYITALTKGLECEVLCVDTGVDTSIAERIDNVQHLLDENEDFFLLNSDTLFDFNIEEMLAVHRREQALVTLSSVEVVSTWGLIILDDQGRLAAFDRQRKVRHLIPNDESGHRGLVNSGLAWLNQAALKEVDLKSGQDFESSLYTRVIEMGRAAHYQITGEWFPIDTPKDLRVINLAEEDRHGAGHKAKAIHSKYTDIGSHSES
jgi:glucose-1-phosphate cytidylyltransferase